MHRVNTIHGEVITLDAVEWLARKGEVGRLHSLLPQLTAKDLDWMCPYLSGPLIATSYKSYPCDNKFMQVIDLIMAHGGSKVNQYGEPLLVTAMKCRRNEIVSYLIKIKAYTEDQLSTCLFAALRYGKGRIAIHLFKLGGSLAYHGQDRVGPLTMCVQTGKRWLVRWALRRGLDPNETSAGSSVTPLTLAVGKKLPDIVAILLENGADANFRNGPNPPLWIAVERQNLAIVDLLLTHGADPNFKNFSGRHIITAELGNTDIVELLVRHGANPKVKSSCVTPVQEALVSGLDFDETKVRRFYKAGFEMKNTAQFYMMGTTRFDAHVFFAFLRHGFIAEYNYDPTSWIMNLKARQPPERIAAITHICRSRKKDNLGLAYFRRKQNLPEDVFQIVRGFVSEGAWVCFCIDVFLV